MHYKNYKTILSPQNLMNLYRGCTHGCIYCDSRSACYNMDHNFEDIEVKSNAAQILDEQLKRKRKKSMIVTGAMCDPYLHLENKLEVTRDCLKVIDKYGFGVCLLTKSNRILRDIDLLKSINSKSKVVVQMTLTTYNEELCKQIEPNVSTTKERVEVLKIMRDEGIPTVVWLGPLLPFINDTEENLKGLLDYCIEAKVKGIVCFGFGVTMREGNREYFYKKVEQKFPHLRHKYAITYGNTYMWNSKNHIVLRKIFEETCKKEKIMCSSKKVFEYLQTFEEKTGQISMFEDLDT